MISTQKTAFFKKKKKKREGELSLRDHVIYVNTADHKLLQDNDREHFTGQF